MNLQAIVLFVKKNPSLNPSQSVWDAISGFVQYAIWDTSWFAASLVKIRFKNKRMRGIVIGYIVVQLVLQSLQF